MNVKKPHFAINAITSAVLLVGISLLYFFLGAQNEAAKIMMLVLAGAGAIALVLALLDLIANPHEKAKKVFDGAFTLASGAIVAVFGVTLLFVPHPEVTSWNTLLTIAGIILLMLGTAAGAQGYMARMRTRLESTIKKNMDAFMGEEVKTHEAPKESRVQSTKVNPDNVIEVDAVDVEEK